MLYKETVKIFELSLVMFGFFLLLWISDWIFFEACNFLISKFSRCISITREHPQNSYFRFFQFINVVLNVVVLINQVLKLFQIKWEIMRLPLHFDVNRQSLRRLFVISQGLIYGANFGKMQIRGSTEDWCFGKNHVHKFFCNYFVSQFLSLCFLPTFNFFILRFFNSFLDFVELWDALAWSLGLCKIIGYYIFFLTNL